MSQLNWQTSNQFFTPSHSDRFVSIECTLSEDMIVMQSLDLAIKACVCVKEIDV